MEITLVSSAAEAPLNVVVPAKHAPWALGTLLREFFEVSLKIIKELLTR